MNNTVPMEYFYVDDTNEGSSTHYKFPLTSINNYINGVNKTLIKLSKLLVSSPPEVVARRIPKEQWLYLLIAARQSIVCQTMQNGIVAVIGSASPWVEALSLVAGAAEVVTVEYNSLTYDHPQITTISAQQFNEFYDCSSNNVQRFDIVISMSSIDHDGLGRYGDPLNPEGDFLAIARMGQLLKPDGHLILTIPIGPDVVVFNLHRRYGERRLAKLLEDWVVVDRLTWDDTKLTDPANWRQSYEPILVLQKRKNSNFPCIQPISNVGAADVALAAAATAVEEL